MLGRDDLVLCSGTLLTHGFQALVEAAVAGGDNRPGFSRPETLMEPSPAVVCLRNRRRARRYSRSYGWFMFSVLRVPVFRFVCYGLSF